MYASIAWAEQEGYVCINKMFVIWSIGIGIFTVFNQMFLYNDLLNSYAWVVIHA